MWLLRDREHDCGLAHGGTDAPLHGRPDSDLAQVGHANGDIVANRDQRIADLLHVTNAALAANKVLLPAFDQEPTARIFIGVNERVGNFTCANAVSLQLRRVKDDLVLFLVTANRCDLGPLLPPPTDVDVALCQPAFASRTATPDRPSPYLASGQ